MKEAHGIARVWWAKEDERGWQGEVMTVRFAGCPASSGQRVSEVKTLVSKTLIIMLVLAVIWSQDKEWVGEWGCY